MALVRITVEEGNVRARYTRSEDDDFHWTLEADWGNGEFHEIPRREGYDGRDVLWQVAAAIGVGAIAGRDDA